MRNLTRIKLPKNKKEWKRYSSIFIPLTLSALLFSFNGLVDNFMVGHINQGQAALGIVNTWTSLLQSWASATAIASTMIISQFYYVGKFKQAQNSARLQMNISFYVILVFFIIGQINPQALFRVYYSGNNQAILINAEKYFRIFSYRWLLMAFGFNMGNILNALGFGKTTLKINIMSVLLNMGLNALFMYYVKMGVQGAALASLISSVVGNTFVVSFIYRKKINAFFNPLTIFMFDKTAIIMLLRRSLIVFAALGESILINFRTALYSAGYSDNSLGQGINGIAVLSLTGAFMAMFFSAFVSFGAMSARFVGSEIAKGNLDKARENSDSIKGFIFTISIIYSLLLVAFSFIIPHMTFLSENKYQDGILIFDSSKLLHQVSISLIVMAMFYPIWGGFNASYNISNSAGKSWKMSLYGVFQQALSFAWLSIIVFVIVPSNSYIGSNIWVTYALFFLIDIIKLFVFNHFYYKYDWISSVSDEEEKIRDKLSKVRK